MDSILFNKFILFNFIPVPTEAMLSAAAILPINNVKSAGMPATKHSDVIASSVSPAPILSKILVA